MRTVTVEDTLKPVLSLGFGAESLHVMGKAETSKTTGELNPAHAILASQESMTRRLLTLNSAPANSWRAIGVIAAAVGSVAVGVALLAHANARSSCREADELLVVAV